MKVIKNGLGWKMGKMHGTQYRKRVTQKKFYRGREVQGWIFDATELHNLKRCGARTVYLYDMDMKRSYDISVSALLEFAMEMNGRYGIFFVVPYEVFEQDFVNHPEMVEA